MGNQSKNIGLNSFLCIDGTEYWEMTLIGRWTKHLNFFLLRESKVFLGSQSIKGELSHSQYLNVISHLNGKNTPHVAASAGSIC